MSIYDEDRADLPSNIFELIEFTLLRRLANGEVTSGHYGVNVAKVREVVRMPTINPLASSVHGVAGVFELRGIPIPAINLAAALGDEVSPIEADHQIIVTEFSNKRAGFIVQSTHRIRRVAWDKVLPPAADKFTCINGMTLIENNEFLFILDLEKILLDIEEKSGYLTSEKAGQTPAHHVSPPQIMEQAQELGRKILLVEDSSVIMKNTRNQLEGRGYSVVAMANGQEAKSYMEMVVNGSKPKFDILVTDIEMPQMDGLSLVEWMRTQQLFVDVPVIIHSSLTGASNEAKARKVGVLEYVVKNDFGSLFECISKIDFGLKAS